MILPDTNLPPIFYKRKGILIKVKSLDQWISIQQINNKLEEEVKLGKFWCWHKWKSELFNFTLGEKYQCQKCQKVKYID